MKELYKALAAFQSEVPTIKKNASGYGYKFADLEEITKVIKPLLTKQGLGYTQPLDGTNIKTIIFHAESGESLESVAHIPQDVELKGQNQFQTMGSAITYLRRYALSSALGLVTDEDADGAGEQVKRVTAAPKAPQATPEPKGDDELTRAKKAINEELERQGITAPAAKKAKLVSIISKSTIDTIDDANIVMDNLEEKAMNNELREYPEGVA